MGVVREHAAPEPVPRISAAGLRRALVAGARHVIARREFLNRINVFPVPDGDTGTNLAFTLATLLGGALSRRAGSAGELLRRVADDALDGARGNSGAILAQFLHGVAEVAGQRGELTLPLLSRAVGAGAAQAHSALAEPREGTILSVIRAFAEAVATPSGDVRSWFGQGLSRAEAALADTPRQLPVLRQAGVVDAGAQGFVDLLAGIDAWLSTGRSPPAPPVERDTGIAPLDRVEEGGDPRHRWCTECVVEAGAAGPLDQAALRAAVQALDLSSLVVAGGGARVRIHAHLAEPARLFACAGRFGSVRSRKADDMHAQQRATGHRTQLAVVTDSGADLPQALLEASGLSMVPARVNIGDEDFLDKVTLQPAELYQRMRAGGELPRTSQPPPGDFRRQFEFLLSHHPALCYVGISRALSGTLQSGESAASRCAQGRVQVLDSGHASCGQGLVALALAEAARAGAGQAALARLAASLRQRTATFACARDIRHAVRGGRIPRWAAPIATWLPLTPIARIRADGRLAVAGALPGRHDVPRRFARHVAARVPPGARVRLLVGHAGCAADGEVLLATLRSLLACSDAWLVEAGPAVGVHAGPGTLVVGVQW
jgi:hypothetical protein